MLKTAAAPVRPHTCASGSGGSSAGTHDPGSSGGSEVIALGPEGSGGGGGGAGEGGGGQVSDGCANLIRGGWVVAKVSWRLGQGG